MSFVLQRVRNLHSSCIYHIGTDFTFVHSACQPRVVISCTVSSWRQGNKRAMPNAVDPKKLEKSLRHAAEKVKEATALIITAGAGMGCDSGLPDFRGPEGLWKAYPPLKERGLTLPETSNPQWFDRDPTFAWGFFGHRLNMYRSTTPHQGFQILKKWTQSKKDGYFIFTSNVDGHFQKAGFPEEKVTECHGSINFLQATSGSDHIWPVPDHFSPKVDETTLTVAENDLPRGPPGDDGKIPEKAVVARPNILMFGDYCFVGDRTDAQEYRMNNFMAILPKDTILVVVEIGAGHAVPTVRYRSEGSVERYNPKDSCLIRINPRDPEIPRLQDISLPMKALEALQRIDELIEREPSPKM